MRGIGHALVLTKDNLIGRPTCGPGVRSAEKSCRQPSWIAKVAVKLMRSSSAIERRRTSKVIPRYDKCGAEILQAIGVDGTSAFE